jgi:hypothetical protein
MIWVKIKFHLSGAVAVVDEGAEELNEVEWQAYLGLLDVPQASFFEKKSFKKASYTL